MEAESASVDHLIVAAERAIGLNQLLTPENDNAVYYLDQAQALNSTDARIAEGFERVTERYLELALRAGERQSFSNARSMLSRAKIVFQQLLKNNPDSTQPDFARIETQINQLANAERAQLKLDHQLLSKRDKRMASQLVSFGRRAKTPGARVIITARNDSEGRWIYQQLREAPGEYRIRGEIQIGSPSRVELIVIQSGQSG